MRYWRFIRLRAENELGWLLAFIALFKVSVARNYQIIHTADCEEETQNANIRMAVKVNKPALFLSEIIAKPVRTLSTT